MQNEPVQNPQISRMNGFVFYAITEFKLKLLDILNERVKNRRKVINQGEYERRGNFVR